MDVVASWRPLLALLVPILAVPLIVRERLRPDRRELVSFVAATLELGLVLSMVPAALSGRPLASRLLEVGPGASFALTADAAGMVFAALASALWLVTTLYSVGYMRGSGASHQTSYFATFAVCVAAAIGIAMAANLITFFVLYEVLTLATFPLVVHNRTAEARAGGRRYLAYTLVAGQLLLLAVVGTLVVAPGAGFRPGGFLAGTASPTTLKVLFALFVAGVGVKVALMPLHGWLPAAMVAPTPVSALLHAVAVVKAGAFGMVRVVGWVFGPELLHELGLDVWLAALAATTVILASVRALGEGNLKRRLAYSTVSQLSYIVLGAALSSARAFEGALFYIAAHGVMKITLFFCAGAIYIETHRTEIAELDGLGRRMPITFAAFTVGALGLAGLPGIVGFTGKLAIGWGALEAGHAAAAIVLLASGVLNLAYFLPILYRAWFRPPVEEHAHGHAPAGEARFALLAPLVVTAVAAIALGFSPNLGLHFRALAARATAGLTFAAPARTDTAAVAFGRAVGVASASAASAPPVRAGHPGEEEP